MMDVVVDHIWIVSVWGTPGYNMEFNGHFRAEKDFSLPAFQIGCITVTVVVTIIIIIIVTIIISRIHAIHLLGSDSELRISKFVSTSYNNRTRYEKC